MHRQFVAQFAIHTVLLTVLVCALWPEERALPPRPLPGVTVAPFVPRVSRQYEGVTAEQDEVFAILDEFFPYDVDGRPVRLRQGYARVTHVYDDEGKHVGDAGTF